MNVVTKLIHKLMNGYYLPLTNEVKGIIYLPLLFRPKRKSYSRSELEAMISQLTMGGFEIEEDTMYQDFIVYGRKLTEGG